MSLEVRHPPKDRTLSQSLEKGTVDLQHLPTRRLCGPPAAERAAAARAGVGRPLPRCAPTSGRRIPHILSLGSGLNFEPGRYFGFPAFQEPPLSLSKFPSSRALFLSEPCSSLEVSLGEKPFLRSLRKSTGKAAGCGRAGLALRNSGGLCSSQLFPDHLTRQLLGKRCC